jgi:hypothetical protein
MRLYSYSTMRWQWEGSGFRPFELV